MDFYSEYRSKLRTPEQAVQCVKSGDWIDYTSQLGFPILLDRALSKRRDELFDVKIRGNLIFNKLETVEGDPTREHFIYNSWHCSGYERSLCDRGLCNFIPMVFRNVVPYYTHFLTVNVAMVSVTPMDKHGYFNLSCSTGVSKGIIDKADIVIVEVNEHLPWLCGGFDEVVHISQVDYVVEGEHEPLFELPIAEPSELDKKIAASIVPYIQDGACLQLGIGSMPNSVGNMIANSDLKDLSMHTELCSDAYYDLYAAGKLTNARNNMHRNKGMFGMAFGTRKLYEWMDRNPGLSVCPLEYVNSPELIGAIDNMVAINNCISVDLYGQVSSESSGTRHISGTGGQLGELRHPAHLRHRRAAGFHDRGGEIEGRQGLHLPHLHLHGQEGADALPDRAPLRRRHRHHPPERSLLRGHGVRRPEPGGPDYLGAGGHAGGPRPPGLPGGAHRRRGEAEHLAAVE